MSGIDLDLHDKLEAEATPRPWVDMTTPTDVRPIASVAGDDYREICQDIDGDDREADRALIVQMRNDHAEMVAEIRGLRAGLRRLASAVDNCVIKEFGEDLLDAFDEAERLLEGKP